MLPRTTNFFTHALRFCTIVPLLALATAYTSGFYTAIVVGRFPIPKFTDAPISPATIFLSMLSNLVLMGLLVCPFAWLLLIGANRRQAKPDDWRIHAAVHSFGWGLIVYLCSTDPGGVIAWWLD